MAKPDRRQLQADIINYNIKAAVILSEGRGPALREDDSCFLLLDTPFTTFFLIFS
jgi:hypothetical protein